MSSEPQPNPEIKTLIPWDRVVIGVTIMVTRTMVAAAIGFVLSIAVPLVGLAEEPDKLEAVGTEIRVADEHLPEDEKTPLRSVIGAKIKAGAVAVRDKIWDPDAALDEKSADLARANEEIARLRKAVAEARFEAGTEHEYISQCARDTEAYLESLREPSK